LSPEEEIQGMEESGHTVDEEEVFKEVIREHLEPQT
jgi:hypothetical protein